MKVAFGWATAVILAAGFLWAIVWTVRGGWRLWLTGWRKALQVWDDARGDVTPAVEAVPDPEPVEQPEPVVDGDEPAAALDLARFEKTRWLRRDRPVGKHRHGGDRFGDAPAAPRFRVGRIPLDDATAGDEFDRNTGGHHLRRFL